MDPLEFSFSANPGLQNLSQQPCPYPSSLASSISSSVSSIFSDGQSSQGSISSSNSSFDANWENDAGSKSQGLTFANELNQTGSIESNGHGTKTATESVVAPEHRQHPRRTASNAACPRRLPSLIRQSERRVSFVDNLVGKSKSEFRIIPSPFWLVLIPDDWFVFLLVLDSAAQIVEAIWPLSAGNPAVSCKGVLPLRSFIQETLRRSRTSYSTLQVALYYLILIKPRIPSPDFTVDQPQMQPCLRAMQCGRRMFLSALILASKYLQDRNYSARAWSKISGLSTGEINQNEMTFLDAVGWRLHISEPVFQRWAEIVLKYTPSSGGSSNGEGLTWRSIISIITPDIDTIDIEPARKAVVSIRDLLSPVGLSPSLSTGLECGYQPSVWVPGSTKSATVSNASVTTAPRRPRLPSLPTLDVLPASSSQSVLSSTPAVSATSFASRRPSIPSALRRVHTMGAQCPRLDQPVARRLLGNQVATSESYSYGHQLSLSRSSTSSPESMLSDVPSLTSSQSSRSSRSSSISSVTSATCAPKLPGLVTRATRRRQNMKEARKQLAIASPIDELAHSGFYTSPEPLSALSVNETNVSIFNMDTPVDMAHEAAQSLCELSVGALRSKPSGPLTSVSPNWVSRKRGRAGSNDMLLQHNVRQLMSLSSQENEDDSINVLPDYRIADSFLLPRPKAVQFPSDSNLGDLKLPPLSLAAETGRLKRVCCGSKTANFLWGKSNASADSVMDMLE